MSDTVNNITNGAVAPLNKNNNTVRDSEKSKLQNISSDNVSRRPESLIVDKAMSNVDDQDPLERAAAILQNILPGSGFKNTRLRIDKDDETGNYIYQTLDTDTGEVVKQFPPETIAEMLSKLREVEGVAFDTKV